MKNELRAIHRSFCIVALPEIPDAIVKSSARMRPQQRLEPGNIGPPAEIAADIRMAVSQEALDQSPAQKTAGAGNKYPHASRTG